MTTTPTRPAVHRFEVRPRPGVADPRAQSLRHRAAALGFPVQEVRSAKVYLVEAPLSPDQQRQVASALLADPVCEAFAVGASPASNASIVEIHPLPGVMDPVGQSVAAAIRDLLGLDAAVSTGVRYDIAGVAPADARAIAEQLLANRVIHQIAGEPLHPDSLPHGTPAEFSQRTIPLRGLDDPALAALSREAHLFLTPEELRAVRDHFDALGRDPTDIELETIAQTWSEHCVHKTLKSTVHYRGPASDRSIDWSRIPGATLAKDGTVTIDNLLKRTVAAATHELIADGVDWALSVFKDNSGVVALDDAWGVNIKVETHNRPSAIEPYGGAATGAGGCIRDVIGTGLGAKPIANTDVFCVAPPAHWADDPSHAGSPLPPGTIHPRRILTDVVAGVRDYGNRMGIPTVAGAVAFDDRYVGNPLVFCGCIGLIPRALVAGAANPGDRIVALGGRTGRDGIHGATFSSAEVEQGHSTEFAHAVQIGNAIEEKRLLDAILRARDAQGGPLYTAITDCGAGGFSSAVGEMGSTLGAEVHLDRAPVKYQGLTHTEIWISEAQERMILAVPQDNLAALQEICDEEGVELCDLGHFGTQDRTLDLFFHEHHVGSLSMEFLHEGIPMPTRPASWPPPRAGGAPGPAPQPAPRISDALTALLGHPDIASKHWIIRQYDHEVQGNTVVKPLVGPAGRGPSDAAVIEPIPGSRRGIALASGLATPLGDASLGGDPYQMALAGIDECVRNLVCAGADPGRIAILDNFCWPSCDLPHNMGALARACAGCYDGAMAYRTPFVSGKDSLNNQLRYEDPATGERKVIEIPFTLLITGLGLVRSIDRCVTMDAKTPGNLLVLVGRTTGDMGGSHYQRLFPGSPLLADAAAIPRVDLSVGPRTARAVAEAIAQGLVASAHDCSEGGVLTAVAEMLIATTGPGAGEGPSGGTSALADLLTRSPGSITPLGADLTLDDDLLDPAQAAFAQTHSRYVLEVAPANLAKLRTILTDAGGVFAQPIGTITSSGRLVWPQGDLDARVDDLAAAWRAPLDW